MVSAPQRIAHTIFSTSSAMPELIADGILVVIDADSPSAAGRTDTLLMADVTVRSSPLIKPESLRFAVVEQVPNARTLLVPANWAQVKRVLRYVKLTADMGLHFGGQKEPWFEGYSDSDWGQDPSRRSTTGYVFTLNGAAVSWQSTRQRTVATSTMEAEYQAAASASRLP